MGVNVVDVTDASQKEINSSLVDHSGKPYTSSYLMEKTSIPSLRFNYAYDSAAQADLTLTLGDAWARDNPLP
jgi:hypothetical protein